MPTYHTQAYNFSITAGATQKIFDPNSAIRMVDIQNRDTALALRLHFGNPWCLSFDGTNDVVACDGVATDIAAHTVGSIRAGIRITASTSGQRTIFSIGDTNAETAFWWELDTDDKLKASLVIAGTAQWTLVLDVALTEAQWYNVAIVHNGVEPVLYVDEDKRAQTFSVDTDKTAWLSSLTGIDNGNIGALDYNSAGNANFFDGKIDYLRINSGLSTISTLALACDYPMDEGTSNLTDRSANANTGTVSGATWATRDDGIVHGASIGREYDVRKDKSYRLGCWATNAGGTDVAGTYKFGEPA